MNYHNAMAKAINVWAKEIQLDAQLLEVRKARDAQWSVLAPYVFLRKTSPPKEEVKKLVELQRELWDIEAKIQDLRKTRIV